MARILRRRIYVFATDRGEMSTEGILGLLQGGGGWLRAWGTAPVLLRQEPPKQPPNAVAEKDIPEAPSNEAGPAKSG